MEEPILSRMDRLDRLLRELEEIRSGGNCRAVAASGASTPSSGTPTTTSDGRASSSVDFSPKSLEKHCRPLDYVVMETEAKGTLVERLDNVEERLHKMEEEMDAERKRATPEEKARTEKKGFKRMVKKIVRGSKEKHNKSSSDGCL